VTIPQIDSAGSTCLVCDKKLEARENIVFKLGCETLEDWSVGICEHMHSFFTSPTT
jgi:hypothetical protein